MKMLGHMSPSRATFPLTSILGCGKDLSPSVTPRVFTGLPTPHDGSPDLDPKRRDLNKNILCCAFSASPEHQISYVTADINKMALKFNDRFQNLSA